jgi:hypothetical protein
MSAAKPDIPFQEEPSGFTSLDTEILIIDGPGDTTVRAPSPLLLKLAMAERARIERWEKLLGRPPSDESSSGR